MPIRDGKPGSGTQSPTCFDAYICLQDVSFTCSVAWLRSNRPFARNCEVYRPVDCLNPGYKCAVVCCKMPGGPIPTCLRFSAQVVGMTALKFLCQPVRQRGPPTHVSSPASS